MKKNKNLLNEGTVHRFMALANIKPIGLSSNKNLQEQGLPGEEEEEDFEVGDTLGAGGPPLEEPSLEEPALEEPALEEPGLGGELSGGDVLSLVDAIADAITAETGIQVRAEEGGAEEGGAEDLGMEPAPEEEGLPPEPEEELGMGLPPEEEEDELALAENYIREKVRAALLQESKQARPQQPSALDQKAAKLYNDRMTQLASRVYAQAKAETLQEAQVGAFSNEVQRRVLSRILDKKKK